MITKRFRTVRCFSGSIITLLGGLTILVNNASADSYATYKFVEDPNTLLPFNSANPFSGLDYFGGQPAPAPTGTLIADLTTDKAVAGSFLTVTVPTIDAISGVTPGPTQFNLTGDTFEMDTQGIGLNSGAQTLPNPNDSGAPFTLGLEPQQPYSIVGDPNFNADQNVSYLQAVPLGGGYIGGSPIGGGFVGFDWTGEWEFVSSGNPNGGNGGNGGTGGNGVPDGSSTGALTLFSLMALGAAARRFKRVSA